MVHPMPQLQPVSVALPTLVESLPPVLTALKIWSGHQPSWMPEGIYWLLPPRSRDKCFPLQPCFAATSQSHGSLVPAHRLIAATDLPLWPGDLAAVLAPTINPRANNRALHQSGRRGSEQEQMVILARGWAGQGHVRKAPRPSCASLATRPGGVLLRPMGFPLTFRGVSCPILALPGPRDHWVLVEIES